MYLVDAMGLHLEHRQASHGKMLKDGGSFYGDIDGKLDGVQEWEITARRCGYI